MTEAISNNVTESHIQIANPVVNDNGSFKWKLHGESSFLNYHSNVRGQSELVKWTPAAAGGVRFLRKDAPTLLEVARFYAAFHRDFPDTKEVNNVKNIFSQMCDEQNENENKVDQYVYETYHLTVPKGNLD